MPRSLASLLREEIAGLVGEEGRYLDMAAQLAVYRCSCGVPHHEWPDGRDHAGHYPVRAEILPRVYGGRYDQVRRRYDAAPATDVLEVPCHDGQLPVLLFAEPGILRVLALGTPGAGKTTCAVIRGVMQALDHPGTQGALVAPVSDRRDVLVEKFQELVPAHWVADQLPKGKGYVLKNDSTIWILSAKRASKQYGNPLQGRDWDWAVVDESQNVEDDSHREIAARGRRAGKRYQIIETATNAPLPAFRVRKERSFKGRAHNRLIRFTGYQNPWVEPEFWRQMKAEHSDRDFREFYLAEDVAPERLVYPRFSYASHICPRGQVPAWADEVTRRRWGRLVDVTEKITAEWSYDRPSRWILAQDFGVLVNATIALKAYQAENGDRLWWCCFEHTGQHTDLHAQSLRQYFDPDECVVVGDPHMNSKESDKSDYHIFEAAGWFIRPAVHGKISVKHRLAMLNALLEDAAGVRRLFVDCDTAGVEKCPMLVRALLTSEMNDMGGDAVRKNGMQDMTHWPSAVAFGVFPWERVRGHGTVRTLGAGEGKPGVKRWWEE